MSEPVSLLDRSEEREVPRAQLLTERRVLVDAHVHLYPSFDRQVFLRAALRHASLAGAQQPWLLLTETSRDFAFRSLLEQPPAGWSAERHGDGRSLTLTADSGGKVMITAGRQVQTEEGLELLTLGSDEPIADGTPLRDAATRAQAAGAIPVIPWGFGKWTGRRARVLAEFMASSQARGVHLGDNGGRPWFWPAPKSFLAARHAGRAVLPGSDPLPFQAHQVRAGSYGVLMDIDVATYKPFAELAPVVVEQALPSKTYGRRAASVDFLRDQIKMQMVKRARR